MSWGPWRTHSTGIKVLRRQVAGEHIDAWDEELDGPMPERPRCRADCVDGPRPCPWVSCRHHLGLDISGVGSLKQRTDVELDALTETCALDVAERGGERLEAIGEMLGLTRERVRQVQEDALRKVRRAIGLEEGT